MKQKKKKKEIQIAWQNKKIQINSLFQKYGIQETLKHY